MNPSEVRQLLLQAPARRQCDLALALGAVAEPFSGLATQAETPLDPLAQVAAGLRRGPSPVRHGGCATGYSRHRLWASA